VPVLRASRAEAITVSRTSFEGYGTSERSTSRRPALRACLRFRLLMYDKTLKHVTPALDSSGTSGALGGAGICIPSAHLIPIPADSTMFLDIASRSLLTIDPTGKVAHVTALPRPQEILTLSVGYIYGTPTLDTKDRLVYQGTPTNQNRALIRLYSATATSVRAKSSPLTSNLLPIATVTPYARQSP